ncbi:MAG: efflux RND transporter periplasmic adaptor subunit [Bacteroidales bacterium]|nr:efflux RND transporter periplasmic adaptor subunit [Bacteroidales bacterium]
MKEIKIKKLLLPFWGAILLMVSCHEKAQQENREEHEMPAGIVEMTGEQMKTAGITLGQIEMKNLHSVIRANGQLVLPPQNRADVNSLMSGIVKEIAVTEGVTVRKGQTLALLENLDIVKLQEEYLTLTQELVYSRQEYERQQELNTQQAGAAKILQQTQAQYEAGKARLKGLETRLRQLHVDLAAVSAGNFATKIPITAPIAGIVGKIFIKTGSYVDMQTTLMEIADHSQMHCDLQVFEKDFPKITVGQRVNISLTNNDMKSISGTVFHVNRSFENESKSIIVHVKINHPNKTESGSALLLPGTFVSALIELGSQTVKAVPADAIAHSDGKQYLFVLDEQNDAENDAEKEYFFKQTEIIAGIAEAGYVEISPLEKLPDSAHIIVKGAFYAMSKVNSSEDE